MVRHRSVIGWGIGVEALVVGIGRCGGLMHVLQLLTMKAPFVVVSVQTSNAPNHSDARSVLADQQLVTGPLPLTPLEQFLLQCATPRSPMVIRVVLRLTGECQPDLYVQTLQRAIERHPMLSCRLQKINRQWCWVSGTPEPIVISRRSGSVFDLESGLVSKFIDLTQSAGLHTSIVVLDDGVKVFMDVHHAATDGNGMRQVITDWFHLYHCEVTSTPSKLPVVDPDRLVHRHVFPQPASIPPISLKQSLINIWATIRGRTSRWAVAEQRAGQQLDATSSHCVEIILSDAQGNQLRERMAAWNVKLNDLAMVCLMSTYAKLAPPGSNQHRVTVLNPIDLRMPSDRSLPATNRFGIAFMRRPRAECLNPVAILRGIHDEMTYVRSNYVGVEFVKGLVTASKMPGGIDLFRRLGFFIPSMQWTCLGDVSRGGKRLIPWKDGMPISGNLQLATATGFAPCADNVPMSIATCEANRKITLTVRSSPRFLTMDDTQKFADTLVHSLCTFELPDGFCHVARHNAVSDSGATNEDASG
ncbi:MAG: hypothetical protein WKF77_11600 [Planctomycetaceae bacterium]